MTRTLISLGLLALACGGGPLTERARDTPVGTMIVTGAPHGTRYAVRAEPDRERLRLVVTEQSDCERLKMKVVRRVRETLRGQSVISQAPAEQVLVADGKDGTAPCNERFARSVQVALRVGTQVYRLGMPSSKGEVVVDLVGEIRQSLYGDTPPTEAVVTVEGVDVGTVSLASYTSHEARLNTLLDEFGALVSKEGVAPSQAEIARSYELFAQLGQLDTAGDARVAALRTRFLERVYQRKQVEETENFKRNMKALAEAKGALALVGGTGVPPFVAAAITGGTASTEAVWWARSEVAVAVRQIPALCAGAPFTWSRGAALPPPTRLALSYLRFAYDDPFQSEVRALCSRGGGY